MLSFLFADDTKCLHVAKINVDFSAIQEDLNEACKLVQRMLFVFQL